MPYFMPLPSLWVLLGQWVPTSVTSLSPSPSLPPQPKSVIELICHRVRLHYAVLTDKNIVKQLVPWLLSPPRGYDSKSRTSLPGPDIVIYFDLGGLRH